MRCRTPARARLIFVMLRNRIVFGAVLSSLVAAPAAFAQEERRVFAGALIGVSTLSADGRAVTTASDASISIYKPENGPALNAFVGVHLAQYFSLQGNYLWNRNDLLLVSSFVSRQGGGFYAQRRESAQHPSWRMALSTFVDWTAESVPISVPDWSWCVSKRSPSIR
jgi:hypothetical protein